jgi:hypothetical protein
MQSFTQNLHKVTSNNVFYLTTENTENTEFTERKFFKKIILDQKSIVILNNVLIPIKNSSAFSVSPVVNKNKFVVIRSSHKVNNIEK